MKSTPLSHLRAPARPFLYGCAYYPEHWPKEIQASDPAWMKEVGFNCVRIGEFSWDIYEPSEGKYDFSFHTESIARLAEAGIKTILCTPTATPPAWLTTKHPEVLRMNAEGVPLQHGSRQHISQAHPLYRQYSQKITRALAQHFAKNPHVIGWQTDNEINCHFSEDHSSGAVTAFRHFLRQKFSGKIKALNEAWGNAFWSLTYTSFDEIPTPKRGQPTWSNPAHALDYARFLSTMAAEFQAEQIKLLRAANPQWFVTHNGWFQNVDYRGPFVKDLDFLSFDSYPFFDYDPQNRPWDTGFVLDNVRSFSGNFTVMEQQSGPGGQGAFFHDNPEPGELRRMAYSAISRGADSLLFFRERSCRFGAEIYWCGILDHDNVPRRRFHEVGQLGRELKAVASALSATYVAVDVAVASMDFDTHYGHTPLSLGLPAPLNIAGQVHRHFSTRGYAMGCVHPSDTLEGVRLYLLPHYAQFDPAWLPALTQWVEAGGVLVIGARSGSRDLGNNVVAETLPGVLRPLCGLTVEEYGRQNNPERRPLTLTLGKRSVLSSQWYEQLQPERGTRVLAKWTSRHLLGTAAITLRKVGRGSVVYVGTYFTVELLAALHPTFLKLAPLLKRQPGWQKGIEIVQRRGQEHALWFYVNHTEKTVTLKKPALGVDLLTNKKVTTTLRLAPNGVAVVRSEKA